MTRAFAIVLLLSASASAQDMPLRDWTKGGEGWAKADGARPSAKPAIDGATATVVTPDGGTMYAGFADKRYLWAYPMTAGKPGVGQPYASLRCPIGKDTTTSVTSLTVDPAGRIYAATPQGVQVFDPTGRLSGVLLAPAKGELSALSWEKDSLVAWVGDQKYSRKMNAGGKQ
jgi:hypothetical protein